MLAVLISAVALTAGNCLAGEPTLGKRINRVLTPLSIPAGTNRPTLWFPVGEQLRYRVSWGVIPVGEIQTTSAWVVVQGRSLLSLTCRTRSNHVLRWIYPVDDQEVAIVDPVGFLPVSFQVDMHEGSHIRHEFTTFNYVAGKAVWTTMDKTKTRTFSIDPELRDLLSFLYYMRKAEVHSDSHLNLRVLVNSKPQQMPVAIGGHETVKVPDHGNVDCLRVTPTLNFEGINGDTNKVTAWISADAQHVCTRVKGAVAIGSITAELIEWSGPGAEQWPAAK